MTFFKKNEAAVTVLAGFLTLVAPAIAQTVPQQPRTAQAPASPAATPEQGMGKPLANPPAKLTPAELQARVADLEEQLKRQTTIAENARLEVIRQRDELALKNELISLGIQRNAELYAAATEIVDKGLTKRSWEPFVQKHRVDMENLKQSYEDRLRAARIYEGTLPPSIEKKMQEDLARTKENGGS